MSDRVWILVTDVCSYVGLSFSVIGNTVLLAVLTCGKSLEWIGSYRYLMIIFALFSLLHTFIETFMRPLMHHYDNTIFVMQRKRFEYSDSVSRILSAAYCGCFAMCFVLFAVHFIYRYYVACKPQKLQYFERKNYAYWVLGMLGIALSWMAIAYFLFPEDDETRNSLNHVLSCYGLTVDEIGYVPYAFFYTFGFERKLRLDNFAGVVHHLTIMQSAIIAVFYCGSKTYWSIVRIKGKSKRTRDLQHEFFKALVVQTTIPLVFMFIPNSVLCVAAFVNGNFGAWANVTVVMTHLYPAIDPFLILFFIKSLRDIIRNFLCLRFNRKLTVSTLTFEQSERREGRSMTSVAHPIY